MGFRVPLRCLALLLSRSSPRPTQALELMGSRKASNLEMVPELLLMGPRKASNLEMVPVAAHGGHNCGHGRLLPSFYVVGAKNSGTSSLYEDLARATGALAAPNNQTKESFFFKLHADMPVERQFNLWFARFPACPSHPASLGDFDTTNLVTVPLPSEFRWAKWIGYPSHVLLPSPEKWDTPRLIKLFHQKAGGRTPQFVLLLRDPLERIHSEYYHNLHRFTCLGCMVRPSFIGSFRLNVQALLHSPRRVSDWFWKSFYARQAEEYLKVFDASQLTFLPDKQYFAANSTGFSTSFLRHLGLDGKPWAGASHSNSHVSRPPLDSELPPDAGSRQTFSAIMDPETTRLARLMARAQLDGAWLVNYRGERGDEAQIRAWLVDSW